MPAAVPIASRRQKAASLGNEIRGVNSISPEYDRPRGQDSPESAEPGVRAWIGEHRDWLCLNPPSGQRGARRGESRDNCTCCRYDSGAFKTASIDATTFTLLIQGELAMGKGNNSQKNDKKNKKPKQNDKKAAAKTATKKA